MNLLKEASNSWLLTRKWNILNEQSNANYDVANEIIYDTELLKSNLYDYNDVYFLVRDNITIIGHAVTQIASKDAKSESTAIGGAENLDLVMSMYSLIEYNSNYSDTTGSLWFQSKEEATTFDADIGNNNTFKSFKYKAKLFKDKVDQPTPNQANGILKNAAIDLPLKYVSNFWSSLEMPLINCVSFAAGD